ncbi:hypothetical protein Zm00014a_040477 [Zea mays]|uniref:Uncharacterized protein n=1 Tax=Zea mays TaxID=4577 RepID=A0A317Y7G2_MAIZE|nr:hypothetical protein Zm00014a_040477 [Zea mays]
MRAPTSAVVAPPPIGDFLGLDLLHRSTPTPPRRLGLPAPVATSPAGCAFASARPIRSKSALPAALSQRASRTVCSDRVEHLPDADVAAGKDMQGISSEKMLFGGDKYQEMRMKVLEITRI